MKRKSDPQYVSINASDSASELLSTIVAAPFGAVGIRIGLGVIRESVYLRKSFAEKIPTDALAERAAQQIITYFQSPDFQFSLPLAAARTVFLRKVCAQIAAIARGDVLTYGEVARLVHSALRAVGQACDANWFPLAIPCHRVTAAGGLGGGSHHDQADSFYVGVKRWLLAYEGLTDL
ncbi:MAG: methylated-DNA--[protein]-cysteine S-methyltransferase [Glaciimonas sp.]|nr:methylated-DNA--[protein]-cysteine S-methyltransferase [Glaciimonas sp.]